MISNLYAVCTGYRQTAGTLRGVPGVIILANILIGTGAGLVSPLFTRYLEALGATPRVVGGLMAVDYLMLIFGLAGGYLADKLGRKRFIVVTHYFFPFILLLFLFARNWVWVLVGMCLLGIRAAAGPAIDAVMADHTAAAERGRIYSLNWLAVTVVTIVTSSVLGLIVHRLGVYQGTRLGFLVYLVLALMVSILFGSRLKEAGRAGENSSAGLRQFFRHLAGAARNSSPALRLFVVYYLLQIPAAGMLSTYYVLYLVHVAGVSDSAAAAAYSTANGVYLFAQLLLGPLTDRLNRAVILSLVTLTVIFSSLTLITFHTLAAVAILSIVLMLCGLSLAVYYNKIFFADLTGRRDRAALFGLISTFAALEGALSLLLGGRLLEFNPKYPFLLSAFFLLAAFFVLRRISKMEVSHQ
ncbi:MAG: MFS transporter [Peptococcaceae bacterium]|nr:MFS transporter [Peptococcaceae bacterium]